MGTKIRVFIASTMKDLSNERHEVVARVRGFNFEPVNAEGWLPQGTRVWERIEKEIESCHLFVLILGDSYGWIPPGGPGADAGLSVTHMEARKARELGLPILPFLKRLDYESPRDTEDARRRDAFRAEVSDWASGVVVAEFELASELASKVGASLVEVLSEGYLAAEVRGRAESARAAGSEVEAEGAEAEPPRIPERLVARVAGRDMVLIAGAGISLAAGYPSMRAMTELVNVHLRAEFDDPSLNLGGMTFQEIARHLEVAFGRDYLLDIFRRAMSGPQGIKPTEAHLHSVRLFKKIITTNFDTLFEDACAAQGIEYTAVENYTDLDGPPNRTCIFKLSGSLSRPESLLITEQDVWSAFGSSPPVWRRVLGALRRSPALVVGSSLRDTAIKMILSDVKDSIRGYIVSPNMNSFERLQYDGLNLSPIQTTADDFFRALSASVARHQQTRAQ